MIDIDRRDLMKVVGIAGIASTFSGSAAASTGTPDRMGPLRRNRFTVEIDDIPVQGFQEVDLPTAATNVSTYREGNDPNFDRQLWGQSGYDELVLVRGLQKGDTHLHDWYKQVKDGKMREARKDLQVTVLDEEAQPQVVYEFKDAWPKEYEGPALDAMIRPNESAIATETITVVYNEFERTQ